MNLEQLGMTFDDIIKTLPAHIKEKLNELKTLRENPKWHPEESCFEHIKIVTNRAIKFGNTDLICTAIFHDLHKLDVKIDNPKTGWPSSPGHDKEAKKTVMFDEGVRFWITEIGGNPNKVASLCGQHMRIKDFNQMRKSKQHKLSEFKFLDDLLIFTLFDSMKNTEEDIIEGINIVNTKIHKPGELNIFLLNGRDLKGKLKDTSIEEASVLIREQIAVGLESNIKNFY